MAAAIRNDLNNLFLTAIKSLVGDGVNIPEIGVSRVSLDKGDFCCPLAHPVFQQLRVKQAAPGVKFNPKVPSPVTLASGAVVNTPADFAQAIVNAVPSNELIGPVSMINGLIQFQLSPSWLQKNLLDILQNGVQPPRVEPQTVVIDFSSPNIAKEMHVGHLRSTIIGDSLSRTLEFCGHKVLRTNHVGDWGTQFGMLIAYLKRTFPDFLAASPNIGDLQSFYKAAKKLFDEDPAFKDTSRAEVVKLQAGDETNLKAWNLFLTISMNEFQKIYDRLDIKLETRGESSYNPIIPSVIKLLEEKGLVTVDKGAKCVFIPGVQQPLIVQKSDGGFMYDSTDIAALWYRIFEQKGDWLIYVVDAGQTEHFSRVFKVGEMAGWLQPGKVKAEHVAFGVVQGEDGKKFKTRAGTSVRLVDLLDEAVQKAERVIRDREAEESSGFSEEYIKELANVVGHGAVKYADLRYNRTTNYVFSFDKMLELNGNTAVYLLYNYVRVVSIMRKVGTIPDEISATDAADFDLSHPSELNLARKLACYPEILEAMLAKLLVNPLCDYLYELCGLLSLFHKNCRVKDDPKQKSRLLLLKAVLLVMRKSFDLLGLKTVDRM